MAMAMPIICWIAAVQGAHSLRDVTRGHIDGCILAHPANLALPKRWLPSAQGRLFRPQPTPFRLTSAAGSNRGSTRISGMLPAHFQPAIRKWGPPRHLPAHLICWIPRPQLVNRSAGLNQMRSSTQTLFWVHGRLNCQIFWICLLR